MTSNTLRDDLSSDKVPVISREMEPIYWIETSWDESSLALEVNKSA
jgi:hypothetical protein